VFVTKVTYYYSKIRLFRVGYSKYDQTYRNIETLAQKFGHCRFITPIPSMTNALFFFEHAWMPFTGVEFLKTNYGCILMSREAQLRK